MGTFIYFLIFLVIAIFFYSYVSTKEEQEKIKAMSLEERRNYLFGAINIHLICPHCQTKGAVHSMRATRVATSTGKVGGILKTDTNSTVTTVVTQHHCDQCNSTWDI
jgi:RecJ-like exonuclease